jgi:hypothetical protein
MSTSRRRATPNRQSTAEQWWPLLRDVGTFSLGGLILVWQLFEREPDPTLVAAALALLGLGPVVRAQKRARKDGIEEES